LGSFKTKHSTTKLGLQIMKLKHYVGILTAVLLTLTQFVAHATNSVPDLTTTGTEYAQPFVQAVGHTGTTFISFGDSMADSYRSIGCWTAQWLSEKVGIAGYSFHNYANTTLTMLANGTTPTIIVPPDQYWFMDYYLLNPGAKLNFEWQWHPNGIFSDRVGAFFVRQTNGGTLVLSISTNAGPWAPLLILDGHSTNVGGEGCFTNVTLPLNNYRLQLESISGSNLVLGPYFLNTQSTGVNLVFMDKGGIALTDVTRVPRSIRDPIFAAFADSPTLLLWHMKEIGADQINTNMNECEAEWSDVMPQATIAYIGTPFMATDSTDWTTGQTVIQNTAVRAIAVAHNRTYADAMYPSVSYEWMMSQSPSYMADTVHESSDGNKYLGRFVWNDLGLFAIGASNSIASFTVKGDGTAQVGYYASTNMTYTIQSSTNLQNWTDVTDVIATSSIVTGGWRTNTIGVSDQLGFFRLKLGPP